MMAVYNRYEGNTGRFRRVDDNPNRNSRTENPADNRRENYSGERNNRNSGGDYARRENQNRSSYNQSSMNMPRHGRKSGFLKDLQNLLPNSIGDLETEDLILLLILYLMYRESGDSELLIIMGAMFLL